MRLPFPTRIPYGWACVFAVALLVAQLLENTSPLFALCCFLFIMLSTAAFNRAEGFSSTAGAYVFFYAMLVVIVGITTKAVIGQPGDSNLHVPQRDILIYLVSISGMYAAVFISRKLKTRKGFLEEVVADRNMFDAAVGCLVTGIAIYTLVLTLPRDQGSVLSALNQINRFLPMAIILGTIYQIRKSGGQSSINAVVLLAIAANTGIGLLSFSKEGIFTGVVSWLIAASSQRYRLPLVQIVVLLAGTFLMVHYLVPYSQYGRSYNEDPSKTNFENVTDLLSRLPEVREEYLLIQKDTVSEKQSFYGRDLGFLERLQMIGPDDGLISVTEDRGSIGLAPIYAGFANLVPHFIWPDKPSLLPGNVYAHEVGGIIGDDDTTTSISFSPSGEAYHLLRWAGVALLAPVLWTMLFTLFDSLCGSTKVAPWGLMVTVVFAHLAPEGMLNGVIYAMGYITFGVVVAAIASAYVMPILGGLIKGPERSVVIIHEPQFIRNHASGSGMSAPQSGQ